MRHSFAILMLGLWVPACELVSQPTGQFHARFTDAGGLREGAPVFVAGVRMGRVGVVKLDGDKARVDFTMDKSTPLTVHDDACVSVGWYAGGETHLKLVPGSASAPALSEGAEIKCVENAGERLESAMKRVDTLMGEVVNGKGTVARLLRDEQLADKVERFFEVGSAPPAVPPSASGSAPLPPAASGNAPAAPPPGDTRLGY